jgi:hypothetical protein
MPTPPNERRSLEQELVELPGQIAVYRNELELTPAENKARRERRHAHRRAEAAVARAARPRLAMSRACRLSRACDAGTLALSAIWGSVGAAAVRSLSGLMSKGQRDLDGAALNGLPGLEEGPHGRLVYLRRL